MQPKIISFTSQDSEAVNNMSKNQFSNVNEQKHIKTVSNMINRNISRYNSTNQVISHLNETVELRASGGNLKQGEFKGPG